MPDAKLTLSEPVTNTQHYECAAWYKISTSIVGVFDMEVISTERSGPFLMAKVPGVVTKSDFTSYFGGVAIGSRDNNVNGEPSPVIVKMSVLDALEDRRVSEISKLTIMQAVEFHLAEARKARLAIMKDQSCLEDLESDRDSFLSPTGSLAHAAERLRVNAEALKKLREALRKLRTVDEHVKAVCDANAAQGYKSSLEDTLRHYKYTAGLTTIDKVEPVRNALRLMDLSK